MDTIVPSSDVDCESVIFSDTIKTSLIKNAAYYEFEMMAFFDDLINNKSYDVVSYFEHSDGNRYCVVHTIFGEDFKNIYETKINNAIWSLSITHMTFMREIIKNYIKLNNCSDKFIFCIAEEES